MTKQASGFKTTNLKVVAESELEGLRGLFEEALVKLNLRVQDVCVGVRLVCQQGGGDGHID